MSIHSFKQVAVTSKGNICVKLGASTNDEGAYLTGKNTCRNFKQVAVTSKGNICGKLGASTNDEGAYLTGEKILVETFGSEGDILKKK